MKCNTPKARFQFSMAGLKFGVQYGASYVSIAVSKRLSDIKAYSPTKEVIRIDIIDKMDITLSDKELNQLEENDKLI